MKAILIPLALLLSIGCEKNFKDKTVDFVPPGTQRPDQPNGPRGPSEPELPSCAKLCADDTTLFSRTNNGHNYLSFTNFGYRGVGRCRGHALVTQKLSLLGEFDDSASPCDLTEKSCIDQLKRGIDQVMSYELYTFDGFSDLYDLSQVPELKAYLMGYVRGTSHRYSANPAKISINDYENQKLNIFYELKRRVELNQLPYVGVMGKQTGSHALLIYETRELGSSDILCARDPNVVLGRSEDCDHYFYHEDGRIYYKRYDRDPDLLSGFSLTSDEDIRIKNYRGVLAVRCERENRFANRCN